MCLLAQLVEHSTVIVKRSKGRGFDPHRDRHIISSTVENNHFLAGVFPDYVAPGLSFAIRIALGQGLLLHQGLMAVGEVLRTPYRI